MLPQPGVSCPPRVNMYLQTQVLLDFETSLRYLHTHTQVSVGFSHVVAVTFENTVFSWGDGGRGQLGHGDTLQRNSAQIIEALKGRTITR